MTFAAEIKSFSRKYSLNLRGRLLDLSTPVVMGVINVTSDSFYSESRFQTTDDILKAAEKMLSDGATILDLGAASSRPGAQEVSLEDELRRAVAAVSAICSTFPSAIVSIDTYRTQVAEACLGQGAALVNDISGGEAEPGMFELVRNADVPFILMHMRGTPQTMAQLNSYSNVTLEVISSIEKRLHVLRSMGVKDVVIDPGFGFAKSISQNFEMLGKLELFHTLDCPLLVGVSRKSMIWKTLKISAEEALNGTTVLNSMALLKGASILRVHDVKEAVECVKLIGQL